MEGRVQLTATYVYNKERELAAAYLKHAMLWLVFTCNLYGLSLNHSCQLCKRAELEEYMVTVDFPAMVFSSASWRAANAHSPL